MGQPNTSTQTEQRHVRNKQNINAGTTTLIHRYQDIHAQCTGFGWTRSHVPTTAPKSLMAAAELLLPPSVPRSVITPPDHRKA